MRIGDIDNNFKIESEINEPDLVWLDIRHSPFDIYGLYEPQIQPRFCRVGEAIGDELEVYLK